MANPVGSPVDYLSQLNAAVPSEVDLPTLDDKKKAERSTKIETVLQEAFTNLTTLDTSQAQTLSKLNRLIKKAEGMQLLSATAKEVAEKLFVPDITIKTRDGVVTANSRLLKAESAMFSAMLGAGMREATTKTVNLDNYSSEAVSALIQNLSAASAEDVQLPSNEDTVRELIDLSMKYGFTELLPKLAPRNRLNHALCFWKKALFTNES